ncbi:hypothetical protein ColLi_11791 [Colletotrichum liriopes]|uniref:Uncharacterized protein n=1 Tax=Colletotrichum liriopes TaxID=708192 RepID=A0AA37GX50_9PEZI|nr:hypothetical protein ColLi_11791 [Colletotrichum liriopes]
MAKTGPRSRHPSSTNESCPTYAYETTHYTDEDEADDSDPTYNDSKSRNSHDQVIKGVLSAKSRWLAVRTTAVARDVVRCGVLRRVGMSDDLLGLRDETEVNMV